MTARHLVLDTLAFENSSRAPRQLWALPWADIHHPQALAAIKADYPDDLISAPAFLRTPPITQGDPCAVGFYVDDWGCKFSNIQNGVVGEIKHPLIADEDYADFDNLRIPEENLSVDKESVNRFCAQTDSFVLAAACPRPFERLQFIRGSQQLYLDLMLRPAGFLALLEKMRAYYRNLLEVWADTDVDALMFMDDWGSQRALLIQPALWVELFKPFYEDFVEIAHRKGKKLFMHSDGYILDILPHLVDMGVDALNSQLFCMGVGNLAPYKGKITFWGEIDRQHLLPKGSRKEIEEAVGLVKQTLWQNGGCIAQCEFGPGANPDNVREVFRTWQALTT